MKSATEATRTGGGASLSVNLLPRAISEHGSDTPRRAEDVERLGEAVVVNQARVDGEDAHKENQIASMEEGVPDLPQGDRENDSQQDRHQIPGWEVCYRTSPAPQELPQQGTQALYGGAMG